eukprot:TRINITY_DN380_c0_g1_i4.p1 TRINITY_DN380_c0_g1~~TRINITY_DN380_c0_g1_i4.p1  ORF type:complete len:444 (-),score=31.81 TRINITY_DN380_c0_g1_i4:55-1242(-)
MKSFQGLRKSSLYDLLPQKNLPVGGNILPLGIYYVSVQLGSPARSFNVAFDTGSSDLIVPHAGCNGCNATATVYDPAASSQSRFVYCNTTRYTCSSCISNTYCGFNNTYETCDLNDPTAPCTITGPIYQDLFQIGPYSAMATFGAITFQTSNFQQFQVIDGVWGVAYQRVSGFNATPAFQALVNAGQLADVFSICLNQNSGILTLGGIDTTLYTGQIGWEPILKLNSDGQYGLYIFHMQDFQVNGVSVGINSTVYNEVAMAIDSGTNGWLLPTPAFKTMTILIEQSCVLADLPGVCNVTAGQKNLFQGGTFTMTPEQIAEFPLLITVLDNVKLVASGYDYLVPITPGSDQYQFGYSDSGYPGLTLIGDVGMKPYYTIFDRQNTRVGFAAVSGNCL